MKISNKINKATKSMGDNTLIATLMGVTTVLVALGIVLSRLWWGDVRFNTTVLDRKNQVNQTLEQNVAILPTLEENFRSLEASGPKPEAVLQALPINEEFSSLSKELEAVASLAGAQLVSVSRVTAIEPAPETFSQPTPVQMSLQSSITGDYSDLRKFISLIEETKRPIRVVKATFTGADPDVTLNLELVTWWQAQTVVGDQKEVITE